MVASRVQKRIRAVYWKQLLSTASGKGNPTTPDLLEFCDGISKHREKGHPVGIIFFYFSENYEEWKK